MVFRSIVVSWGIVAMLSQEAKADAFNDAFRDYGAGPLEEPMQRQLLDLCYHSRSAENLEIQRCDPRDWCISGFSKIGQACLFLAELARFKKVGEHSDSYALANYRLAAKADSNYPAVYRFIVAPYRFLDSRGEMWIRSLLDAGNVDAMFLFAAARIESGETRNGVPGEREAIGWLEKAAIGRDTDSMLLLSRLYLEGTSVPQDFALAHMWLNIAASEGDESAAALRNSLESRMGQEQVAEAQRLAREWVAKYQHQ